MKVLYQSYEPVYGRNVIIEEKELRALGEEQDFTKSISE